MGQGEEGAHLLLGRGHAPPKEGADPARASRILLPPRLEGLECPREDKAGLVEVGDEPVEFLLLVFRERFRRDGLRVWVRVREWERVGRDWIVARRRRERVFECRHGSW